MKVEVEIPCRCHGCSFENFNVWGALLSGRMRVEVRCMRCERVNWSHDDVNIPEEGEKILS